jgi:hypothetical protein
MRTRGVEGEALLLVGVVELGGGAYVRWSALPSVGLASWWLSPPLRRAAASRAAHDEQELG